MIRYFKYCLWSPLWLPALLWAAALAIRPIWPNALDALPQWLVLGGFIVAMSLVFGGLQYLAMLFFIWPKINFCDARSWLKWVLRLPLIFAPILLLGLLPIYAWQSKGVVDFAEALPLGLFGVAVGYLYVAIWILGYASARGIQHLRRCRSC